MQLQADKMKRDTNLRMSSAKNLIWLATLFWWRSAKLQAARSNEITTLKNTSATGFHARRRKRDLRKE